MSGSFGLLDLGDVSQDLDALRHCDAALRTSHAEDALSPGVTLSEESSAEYENISSPGGSSTCSGPTYKRHQVNTHL